MAKLTKAERERCRLRAVQAALLAYRHRATVHYTQDSPERWSGINGRQNASKGQHPHYADCSAFTTWCLWNGLWLAERKPDVVNGTGWKAGFTGTQIEHGRHIGGAGGMMRGDLVFYASSGQTPTHVAICVGRKGGRSYVVSHGNEAGPLFLRWNYRRHVQIRRYVHDGV